MGPLTRNRVAVGLLVALATYVLSGIAHATLVLQSQTFPSGIGGEQNDCPGAFGRPFGNCVLSLPGLPPSAVIFKTPAETNDDLFPTINGSEFAISIGAGGTTGAWTYTQGAGDPEVLYWVAKAGTGFKVFFMDDDAIAGLLPVAVTSGVWDTIGLNNPQGIPQALSHLAFYDSGGGPPPQVPEPGSLVLAGTALAALGLLRRRRV